MKESLDFAISDVEREIADKSVQMALDAGASAVMVSLDKAKTEIYALLDGEIDNIRQTGDRSLTFNIYADGKYGTFSTNRFEEDSLRDFLCKAVETVRMLVADPFRGLPDKKDLATDAVNGDEMGLCWYGYDSVTREEKLEMARRVSVFGEFSAPSSDRNWRVVSEEVEYNNTLSDTYLTSSDGCRCRQTETSFEVSSQATVEDNDGNKYTGLWWDYDVSPEKVLASECGRKAVEMAVMQISPVNADKGKYTMVVSRLVSGRLLQPVLNALSSLSVYQKSSFLVDALGKQVFSKGLNVVDMPLEKGKSGAILFETDGRACRNREIITDGVVKENFTSIYMSRKLGIPPTSSCPNRPVLLPFVSEALLGGERGGGHCGVSGAGFDGSGLGGDCGGVSGDGRGAVSGDGRGVELGAVNGAELGEMSGSGLGGDCGEVSGDVFGAVSGDGRGVELGEMSGSGLCGDCGDVSGDGLGAASGDGRGTELAGGLGAERGAELGEMSGCGLCGDCGEVNGGGRGAVSGGERGAVSGGERGAELGAVSGCECGVELGAVNGGERGVELGAVNGGERGVELGAVNGAERGLKADPFVNEIAQRDILDLCGSGILVTDFNGGNCNSATGDFSYGVSGFLFENGKITSPIDSMLITGNMTDLWSNLLAAGSDPVPGMSRQVPTLAFRDVTFNA
ncbi:MAG: metallopeptidase TldD-related protein [Bacteroidales bacterium]|nr:metallopeptidase TldD-related protein [Bacteroidales bacterium]